MLPSDPEASEFENRVMETPPQLSAENLLSGYFFDRLEKALSDSVAYRTTWLQFSSDLEQLYGIARQGAPIMVNLSADDLGMGLIPYGEDEILPDYYGILDFSATPEPISQPIYVTPTPAPMTLLYAAEAKAELTAPTNVPTAEPEPIPPQETTEPIEEDELATPTPSPTPPPVVAAVINNVNPVEPFGVDIAFNENAILIGNDRTNKNVSGRYAEILNKYRSDLPDNIRIFSLLTPTLSEFLEGRSSEFQLYNILHIHGLLDDRIITVNAYDYLADNKDQYLFFRTDHHWTALGAYYAYLAFAEAAGMTPITIENYTEHRIDGFLGSLGRGTQNKIIRDHPDTLYYYRLNNGTTFSRRLFHIPEDLSNLSYRVFMGGDYAILDFTSSNKNGMTLVVVKDSFANALIPWVAPNYERIIVIDPRHYDGSVVRLLLDFGHADLMFMNYIHATAMADFVEMINNVR
jgi:hypothetical protein